MHKQVTLSILLLLSVFSFAQKDTTRYPTGIDGKDTLLIIKEITTRTATYSYTIPDIKITSVIKTYIPPGENPSPPGPVPSKIEGYGVAATGGGNYSSNVYHVTNTNNSGTGSFAAGLGSNKTIVFDISGTFRGGFNITQSNLTIDGGDKEIIFSGGSDGLSLQGQNIILKNIYVTGCSNDGINVVGGRTIVISNVCSWGNMDGNIDLASGTNVTVQYSIIGNGGKEPGNTDCWAGGMLITLQPSSIHHNLFCVQTEGCIGERAPYVHSNYSSAFADVRNNIVWKWGRGQSGNGIGSGIASLYGAKVNAVNNFVYTNNSGADFSNGVTNTYGAAAKGNLFAAGNVSGNGINANAKSNSVEFFVPAANQISMQPTCEAVKTVLANVGPVNRNSIAIGFINQVNSSLCK